MRAVLVALIIDALAPAGAWRTNSRTFAMFSVSNANHEMMFVEHDTMEFGEATTNAPQAPEYFMVMASWLCRQIRE